jgi:hypothetical protein
VRVFREAKLVRMRRQAATRTRALRAGRFCAKGRRADKPVDGGALLQLLREVGADAQLIGVPVNRPPWTPTKLHVDAGDRVGGNDAEVVVW